ncbi:unnamed protein product, partial [Notodromas monacha]
RKVLATAIESRVLCPAILSAYRKACKDVAAGKSNPTQCRSGPVVEFLMSIVEAHFTVIDRKAVGVLVREVESMFIEFFDYRRLFVKDFRKPKEYATVDLNVSRTEDSIVKAFLAPIMKLSAEGFAPVFYK